MDEISREGNDLARRNLWILVEVFFVLGISLGLAFFVAKSRLVLFVKYRAIIFSSIWLYIPLLVILFKKENPAFFAVDRIAFLESLKWFFFVSLLTLPLFYFISAIGAIYFIGKGFQFRIPKNLKDLIWQQLILVALAEEWFFRGYLQGRFNQVFGYRWRLFGARAGHGLLFSSLIFALAHLLLNLGLFRLLVFFPSLLFGWLREKTGSLFSPILFHFVCNLSFIIFQGSLK